MVREIFKNLSHPSVGSFEVSVLIKYQSKDFGVKTKCSRQKFVAQIEVKVHVHLCFHRVNGSLENQEVQVPLRMYSTTMLITPKCFGENFGL